jgi:hypothetical protein
VQISGAGSTSGYAIQPNIVDYTLVIMHGVTEMINETQNSTEFTVDRNLLTPDIIYDVTLTVKNFIDATHDATDNYSYTCAMVTLAISTSSFINDYSAIQFTMNKAFSIQDAGLLESAEYDTPV